MLALASNTWEEDPDWQPSTDCVEYKHTQNQSNHTEDPHKNTQLLAIWELFLPGPYLCTSERVGEDKIEYFCIYQLRNVREGKPPSILFGKSR